MRVWDVHPGYLSRQSLLGQHAEIHAIAKIIGDQSLGYANHPETRRWRGQLRVLAAWHDLTIREMALRHFNHSSPFPTMEQPVTVSSVTLSFVDPPARQFALLKSKYIEREQVGRIPLPKRGSAYWSHHKYAVMARGYRYYQETADYMRTHPDRLIEMEDELIERVLSCLTRPPSKQALRNVIDHLWGYFNKVASPEARRQFFDLKEMASPQQLLDYLFGLAEHYQEKYLLHSTVFADLVEVSEAEQ